MTVMERATLGAASLAAQREHLTRSLGPLLGPSLAAASLPLPGLDDDGVEAAPVLGQLCTDPAALDALLTESLPGLALADAAAARRCLDTSDDPRALSALLLRALRPLEALRLQPLATLLGADLLAALASHASAARPAPVQQAVTGIVKVTRRCNLRCTYCHDWRTGADAAMGLDTRLKAMRWLVADSGARDVRVLLHGGEPLLIGERGMLQLLAMQACLRTPGQRVVTHVQSNGTHITEGLLRLLRHFDIGVSVSLDGPPEVHDRTRRDAAGRPTAERVMDGLARLQARDLLSGVVIVVTPELVAHGAVRLVNFLRDQGLGRIALLPMRPEASEAPVSAPPEHRLDTRTFLAFLRAVHTARLRLAPWLQVRELDALLRAERSEAAGTCELQGHCVGSYYSIEPDGRVMHCDKYLGDGRYVLGHVGQPYASVADGPRAAAVRRRAQARQARMQACRWHSQCRGWCPHEDYVQQQAGVTEAACCGLSGWFDGSARAPTEDGDA